MGRDLREFLRILAVCHTVVPERNEVKLNVHYHASSPGKLALLMSVSPTT